jgi:hypothetical protein
MLNTAKNLSHEPPRSPRIQIHGYALIARLVDKGRAAINGTIGDYYYECVLDKILFAFKALTGKDVGKLLATGANDDEVAEWIDTHGTPRTADEVIEWSKFVERENRLLFDYLENDDKMLSRKYGIS